MKNGNTNQMIKTILFLIFQYFMVISCISKNNLEQYGQHYQKNKDFKSLEKAVALMSEDIDTSQVKKILGEPIDNGFDYRYLVDSIGENNCNVGAVFNINLQGKITHRWLGEICE
jgi:hypothetical protein